MTEWTLYALITSVIVNIALFCYAKYLYGFKKEAEKIVGEEEEVPIP